MFLMLSVGTIKKVVLPLAKKYDLTRVDLFGSYACGKATENSDADFLVMFRASPPSIFRVMGLREELINSLGYPVDIVVSPIERKDFDIGKVVTIYEQA